MKILRHLLLCSLASLASAAMADSGTLTRREWTVDGVRREALVHVPEQAKAQATPVVFVFHGHGGSVTQVAGSFRLHEIWPEALVVYMQGLPTPGRLTDRSGKQAGWQREPGDQGDRDLKFFDAVLATLRTEFRVDAKRIYATGHSNGGSFTYILWASRPAVFAAYAPSGAVAGRSFIDKLGPAPVLHIAGRDDTLVKFRWQEKMIAKLVRLNGCGPAQRGEGGTTVHPSKEGTPVAAYLYDGGHKFPAEAGALIAGFFQAQERH